MSFSHPKTKQSQWKGSSLSLETQKLMDQMMSQSNLTKHQAAGKRVVDVRTGLPLAEAEHVRPQYIPKANGSNRETEKQRLQLHHQFSGNAPPQLVERTCVPTDSVPDGQSPYYVNERGRVVRAGGGGGGGGTGGAGDGQAATRSHLQKRFEEVTLEIEAREKFLEDMRNSKTQKEYLKFEHEVKGQISALIHELKDLDLQQRKLDGLA
eukprot:Rmarinus@m.11347